MRLLLGHQGFRVERFAGPQVCQRCSETAILLLKLLSIPRFTVGVLDHAFREPTKFLVQVRIVVGEFRAQVLDIHFLLHVLDSDLAPSARPASPDR